MLHVTYGGRGIPKPRYTCHMGNMMHGIAPCITFGARRPDATIGREIVLAVAPLAVEAAFVAHDLGAEQHDERRRALQLEHEQAQYEAKLAAVATNRLTRTIVWSLPSSRRAGMQRWGACANAKHAYRAPAIHRVPDAERSELLTLANDFEAVWSAPSTDARTKQRIVRALIEEIAVDVDDDTRDVIMVVHWRGGQRSELRFRKPAPGEHTMRSAPEVDDLISQMGARWSDEHIAATLNRMSSTTPYGHTWNAKRVGGYRRPKGIPGYESAVKDGRCLTMLEAAQKVGVKCHVIRKPIRDGVLPAKQYVFDGPWQLLATNLERPEVKDALRRRRKRTGRPCRNSRDDRTLVIPGT